MDGDANNPGGQPKPTAPAYLAAPAPPPAQPPMLPRPVVLRPDLLQRWPTPPVAHPVLLVGLTLLGLLAASTLVARTGLQYLMIGLFSVSVIVTTQRLSRTDDRKTVNGKPVQSPRVPPRGQRTWRLVFTVVSLALLAVVAIRDGMTTLTVLAALGLACYAVVLDNRFIAAVFAPALAALSTMRATTWVLRTVLGLRHYRRATPKVSLAVLRGSLVTACLLLVVGGLLAGADDAFSGLLHSLVPSLSPDRPALRLFLAGLVVTFVIGLAYAAVAPADLGPHHHSDGRQRIEWLLPVLGLVLVLASFLLVQAAVLFDRYPDALVEGDLTPAERARQGFGHLVAVTLIVMGTLAWIAARVRHGDRAWFALTGGLLLIELLFLAASALRRLLLYSDAFGWSVARVQAGAFESWLALTLVISAGLWLLGHGTLLTRVSMLSAGLGVVVLGLLSPDALVARASVERYAATGKIDRYYLQGLSADAVPALSDLPEPMRSCVLSNQRVRTLTAREQPEPWYSYNVSRARADQVLWAKPVAGEHDCTTVR